LDSDRNRPLDSSRISASQQPTLRVSQSSSRLHPQSSVERSGASVERLVTERPSVTRYIRNPITHMEPIRTEVYERPLVQNPPSVRYYYHQPVVSTVIHEERHIRESNSTSNVINQKALNTEEVDSIKRIKERNEELLELLRKNEHTKGETIDHLRKSLESYYDKMQNLEEKYKKIMYEKNELINKLEEKNELLLSIQEKILELENELKEEKKRTKAVHVENLDLEAQKKELDRNLQRLIQEYQSVAGSQDINRGELLARSNHFEEHSKTLEIKVAALENELQNARRVINEYQERSNFDQRTEQSTRSMNRESDYEGLKERLKDLQGARNRLESLESKLKSSQEIIENFESERNKCQSQLQLKEEELRSARQNADDLNRRLESQLFSERQEKERAHLITTELEALRNKKKNSEEELLLAKISLQSSEHERKRLEMLSDQLSTDIHSMRKLHEATVQTQRDLEYQLELKNGKLQAAQNSNSKLEAELHDLSADAKNKTHEIVSLEKIIESLKSALGEKSKALSEERSLSQGNGAEGRQREDELTQVIMNQEEYINKLETENEELRNSIEQFEDLINLSREELLKLTETNKMLLYDNATFQARLNKDTSQNNQTRNNEDKLSTMNEQLTFQLSRLILIVKGTYPEQAEG
jgi:chromosome segregation ATPase